jgi:hypothetical protein
MLRVPPDQMRNTIEAIYARWVPIPSGVGDVDAEEFLDDVKGNVLRLQIVRSLSATTLLPHTPRLSSCKLIVDALFRRTTEAPL